MCGRVRLSSDVSEIKLVFSIPPHRPTPNTAPSWNVAPTDPLPVVRYDAQAGERSLDVWPEWLGEKPADPSRLKALLAPYPSEEMMCWPVSARVGNIKNNDPSLIEPITATA
jgi:putative SOS response-associated peptidase YedK